MDKLLLTAGIICIVLSILSIVSAEESNQTQSQGDGVMNGISDFLTTTSPIFLLILGIILIVASGLAKLIGVILIVFAIIRILIWIMGGKL